MSKQHFAGGPFLCSLGASLHLSPFQKRGTGKSRRLGWRRRTPMRKEGGQEGGRGRAEVAATPGCRHRATGTRAAAGDQEPRVSSGAREPEGKGARGTAARLGPAAAAPTAAQQSVRLLLQLPAVEGLRGRIASRREGRGGMKAARSQPGEVGRDEGCSEPSTSTLRHPPVQGAPAR